MKQQSEFYIGWQEEMPVQTRQFLQRIVIALGVLLVLLVATVVILQKPFNNHNFEFGTLTEIEGTYFSAPSPIIIANPGQLDDDRSPEILLVGYGKFGAEGIMRKIQDNNGSLDGKQVRLSGTLIYGDGKTLMELTEETDALVEVSKSIAKLPQSSKTLSDITLKGEIIDPKCYFGVMKPGEGKTHKSCAIRCISGGIPPVLRTNEGNETAPDYHYFLIKDAQGQAVNQAILSMVGELVQLKGKTSKANGWDVLFIDISNLPLYIMRQEDTCAGHPNTKNS